MVCILFFDATIVQGSLIYKSWLKKTGQMVQDNSVWWEAFFKCF